MLKNTFLILLLFVSLCASAQEIKENLELAQVTMSGDSVLVTGFKPGSDKLDFVVVLYDKQLNLQVRFAKKIEAGAKSYFVERINNTFRFTFYSATNKIKYRISTDLGLKQLYAGVPVEKEITDENIDVAEEWTYATDYCNDIVYGNYMMDAQLSGITCYTLLDSLENTYRLKWEKLFDKEYQKVELIAITNGTAYYSLICLRGVNEQLLLAIDLATGNEKFKQKLNGVPKTDTLATIGVSNMYTDGKTIYLAGTYLIEDEENPQPYGLFTDNQSKARGFDDLDFYIMYMADGYFIMSLDAASGAINAISLFEFPSVDKSVDARDYRVAVCPGIAPLKDGRFVAFFEQLSCRSSVAGISPTSMKNMSMGDEITPRNIIWTLDAFTSVIFDANLTEGVPTTTLWEDENVTYNMTDFDMIGLNVHTVYPPQFVTIGDDGCYPHQFICDGTEWTFVIRCDETMIPDFILRGNESQQKVVKLLNARIVYMLNPLTAVEEKRTESTISLKVVKR